LGFYLTIISTILLPRKSTSGSMSTMQNTPATTSYCRPSYS